MKNQYCVNCGHLNGEFKTVYRGGEVTLKGPKKGFRCHDGTAKCVPVPLDMSYCKKWIRIQ